MLRTTLWHTTTKDRCCCCHCLLLLLLSLLHSVRSVSLNHFFSRCTIFYTSNTCITFCITFYSRQCSVSLSACLPATFCLLVGSHCCRMCVCMSSRRMQLCTKNTKSLWLSMCMRLNFVCWTPCVRQTHFDSTFFFARTKKWTLGSFKNQLDTTSPFCFFCQFRLCLFGFFVPRYFKRSFVADIAPNMN